MFSCAGTAWREIFAGVLHTNTDTLTMSLLEKCGHFTPSWWLDLTTEETDLIIESFPFSKFEMIIACFWKEYL
jgi:hypothetical protein